MGGYCNYCGRRCFALRVLASNETLLLATCQAGMKHDQNVTGQDYTTAHNPVIDQFPCQPDCVKCQVAATFPKEIGKE